MEIPIKGLTLLLFVTLLSTSITANPLAKHEYKELMSMRGNDFRNALRSVIKRGYKKQSYRRAKEIIFQKLDNRNGEVCGVYEYKCIRTSRVPDHKVMNVEHTWPQSKGARGNAKSDLHHLFPTDSKANSRRSSFKFCNVVEARWEGEYSKLGYDEDYRMCFEPPHEHKGNVARALFYFSIMYNMQIDSDEEAVLREWHLMDPVDGAEISRNRGIVKYQKNSNAFVEHPEFVDKIGNF
jgi:endonuclease I